MGPKCFRAGFELSDKCEWVMVLKHQSLNTQPTSPAYLSAWQSAFGTIHPELLPAGCTPGTYCAGYGPPLDYLTLNADGALGGNPAFSGFLDANSITGPEGGESGWKDTVSVPSDQVITLLVRWTPSDVANIRNRSWAGKKFYKFDPTQGTYVWHCHIIDHEDNEMMRPYRVTW